MERSSHDADVRLQLLALTIKDVTARLQNFSLDSYTFFIIEEEDDRSVDDVSVSASLLKRDIKKMYEESQRC